MHTIAACVLVLVIAQGVLAQSTSATLTAPDPGTVEVCDRLHVFTANSHSGETTIEYRNSQSSVVSTTVFQDDSLPLPAVCGESYKRCNLHITSNYDESIRVAIFPLNSGIGLVSYDYLDTDDTLIFREKFVLTQTVPDCTYMYFTEAREVVGYCLDLHSRDQPYMHSLRIGVHHSMLNQSIVRRHNTGESIGLINLGSLSDLVFFDFHRDPVKRCFPDEGGHIVCLENGEVLDHSFSGENFDFYPPHISECSNTSRLFHVGATCKLAAHCNDKVFLFEVHQDQATALSNGGSGQVFVCPDLHIMKSRTGTLSLQTESGTQTGKIDSFPLERIRQGDCFIIDNHYIFFATLVDGRTLLANFTNASYQQLGTSEHATYVPSGVKGQIGLVHNGNNTVVYDLSLTCNQERMVIPDNFILANYFSTGTRDQCWCPSVSGTSMPVNQSTSSPTSTNNSQSGSVEVVVVVVVVVVVILMMISAVVVLIIIVFCIYKKHKENGGDSTSSNENRSQLLHSVEKTLIDDIVTAVNLEILSNGDQKSASDSGSVSSQDIANHLLDDEQRLDCSPLPEIVNLNPGHQELRPESTLSGCTSETTTDSVLIQESYLNHPSSDHEVLIGATATASTSSCSVYPHKRLQEVGQASTTAVQCTSPRNSIIYAGAGSPSHTPGPNMVVVPQRSPLNYSAAVNNLSQSESIVIDTLHPPPVEATPDDGCRRNYMAAPHHFLASGANPHPDDVRRIHQQRTGRANEEDFGEPVDFARANGGDSQPNNDVAQVERQRSNEQ